MDFSVAVIPVTKADKSIDLFDREYEPLNDADRQNWEACKQPRNLFLRAFYYASANAWYQDCPETYDGAPVGLQIVARKHEEEKVWAIAKIVNAALNANGGRD